MRRIWNGNWVTFSIAALYVLFLTLRYVVIEIANKEQVLNSQGEIVQFQHPLFETIAGYTGEFVICSFFYLAQYIFEFKSWQSTEIRF